MRTAGKKRLLAGMLTVLTTFILGVCGTVLTVRAASGTVYTCTISRSYIHPVTGVIEDAGGEGSYATGQGMVEGCVYSSGMLEVTDDGSYFLTVRVGLSDYTTSNSFQVQNVGDSGWSSPAMGVTGNGSDSNGTTRDYCLQVPSENCVVRGSMYVEPMGRDVIFYFYPSGYTEGNSFGMNATMVTEVSVSEESTQASNETTSNETTSNDAATNETATNETATNETATNETTSNETNSADDSTTTGTTGGSTIIGDSTILSAAVEPTPTEDGNADADGTINRAQGLSLSTAENSTDADKSEVTSVGSAIAVQTASITIAGLIVLSVGAVIVYYFRKNWYRWGGGDDDDE